MTSNPFKNESDLQAYLNRARAGWKQPVPAGPCVPELPASRKERYGNQTTLPFADMEPAPGHAPLGEKKSAGLDPQGRCRIHVHSRRYKLADPDGISAKAAIDGLVLAGVLPDDSAKCVSQVTFSQEKITSEEIEETVIEVTNESQ